MNFPGIVPTHNLAFAIFPDGIRNSDRGLGDDIARTTSHVLVAESEALEVRLDDW